MVEILLIDKWASGGVLLIFYAGAFGLVPGAGLEYYDLAMGFVADLGGVGFVVEGFDLASRKSWVWFWRRACDSAAVRCEPVCTVHAEESVSCDVELLRLGVLGVGSMAMTFSEVLVASLGTYCLYKRSWMSMISSEGGSFWLLFVVRATFGGLWTSGTGGSFLGWRCSFSYCSWVGSFLSTVE